MSCSHQVRRLISGRNGLHRSRGVTLVELMIAIVLGLLVSGAAITFFIAQRDGVRQIAALSFAQNQARLGFEVLARDLRGVNGIACGNPNLRMNTVNSTSDLLTWPRGGLRVYAGDEALPNVATAVGSPVFGQRVDGSEAIVFWSATLREPQHIISHDPVTATLVLADLPAGDFQLGELAVVCNSDQATLFQVSQRNPAGVSAGPSIRHDTSPPAAVTPGNCRTNLARPSTGAADCSGPTPATAYDFDSAGLALVSPVRVIGWYVGHGQGLAPALFRFELLPDGSGALAASAPEEIVSFLSDRQYPGWQLRFLAQIPPAAGTAAPPQLTGYVPSDSADLPIDAAGDVDWSLVRALEVRLDLQLTDGAGNRIADPAGDLVSREFPFLTTLRTRMP